MKHLRTTHAIGLSFAVVFTPLSASVLAAGETIVGEQLDPAAYGPSIVESLEDVMAREAARPPQWMANPKARNGEPGTWVVPGRRSTSAPRSGAHHATNKWGDTEMGIGFPELVDVHGAYFAGQGGEGSWTTGIRAIGYRSGVEIDRTEWFDEVGADPMWFEMNLCGVDRIVIWSQPVVGGAGWYAMDDFTFTFVEDTGQGPIVLDFEDLDYRTSLTGSYYAGLTWEAGSGDFEAKGQQAIHHPLKPPGTEEDEPPAAGGQRSSAQDGGTLPELQMDFQAVKRGDAGQWSYPPDTDGAVGPDHYVTTVNTVIAVYSKTSGDLLWSTSLSSFMPGSGGDPRVLYDQHSERWITINSNFSWYTEKRIYLAVSSSSDPSSTWFKTSFDVAPGDVWADYPTLGVDAHGIYIAAYTVGGVGSMAIYAIDKAPLVAPVQSLGTITAFRNLPWEGAIQPVHTYGDPGGEYFISRDTYDSLRVRRVNPPLTSPTLTDLGSVPIPLHYAPPNAPALGSATRLDTVGSRLMMSVYRDGTIWTCHTINIDGRAACRWYEVDPESPELIQYGTVSDSLLHYFFPSIMVNQYGHVAMGFTGSSSDQYAAAYYTGRSVTDPPGEMAPPAMYKEGTGPQNNIDSYGRNRWGDYSYTTLDPVDEQRFWTIQEYGDSTNVWGTWVGVLVVGDCNRNGIDDSEDIAAGTSLDLNENGVPDECEVVTPVPQTADKKNRYVTFQPNNPDVGVAFQLELTEGPGLPGIVGWVGEPEEWGCPQDCSGEYFSRLVDAPVYRAWPEFRIHVGDCAVVPAATYNLRATGDAITFTEPIVLKTIVQPSPKHWGDVVGSKVWITWGPPDGNVNMSDVQACVEAFQHDDQAPFGAWVDVDGEIPNAVINMTDIFLVIQAFKGEPYPFSNPSDCP